MSRRRMQEPRVPSNKPLKTALVRAVLKQRSDKIILPNWKST